MLYKKNTEHSLSRELFQNPTCEYRGTPFWAWNCKMNMDQLSRQIECFKEMGLGGFHMHSRVGMDVPYLSDEFMALVKSCVEKAEGMDMLAWLYDEDRWPSGAAGGLLTKEKKYRSKALVFTLQDRTDDQPAEQAYETGATYFLAAYDVQLDENGFLGAYSRIGRGDTAKGRKWYAFSVTAADDEWYNGQAYADLLSKETMDRFIEITYDRYKEVVGDRFGKSVPAIFTDEPNFTRRRDAEFSTDENDLRLPWSNRMDEDFKSDKGADVLDTLPELFWMLPDNAISKPKYDFMDFISERFARCFADNCGKWCGENNLMLTGHLLSEETLGSQAKALGEAMRSYRSFQLPGIDMLCDHTEFSTAKQAQSAAHQYGKEGVLSELYGVTNWDFDFRGHKFQGDWQAALGVSVRVHHLSWVSMAGEAKRDYPASISYQSSWFKEYPYIEDHFARVNTALTRGKPVVKVGVIHPIESYWLFTGPNDKTAEVRKEMEDNFENTLKWLLFGQIDFDFIAESLLPDQCKQGANPLQVGEMAYDTVIVPNLLTIRSSTLERLEAFQKQGGKVIFMGACPKCVDAAPGTAAEALYAASTKCQINKASLLQTLEDGRLIDIRFDDGERHDNLIYNLREDNDCKWLFICQGSRRKINDVTHEEDLVIRIKGSFRPELYDTLSGEICEIPYTAKNGVTEIVCTRSLFESILLRLVPASESAIAAKEEDYNVIERIDWKKPVPYTLSEPNVLLLDRAEYSLDGEPFQAEEEILCLDNACRTRLGWPLKGSRMVQPWAIEPEEIKHSITLRMRIHSTFAVKNAKLAIENLESLDLQFNGTTLLPNAEGWFVDESIKTLSLPEIQVGENILEVKVPFGVRTNTEWCYVLGDFNVKLAGCYAELVPAADRLAFSSVTAQGLPFYGANVTYKTGVTVPENKAVRIKVPFYRGALVAVAVDGKRAGRIVYPPYALTLYDLAPGKHTIDFTLFGTRNNCFAALHNANLNETWHGPGAWRTKDDGWCYEYMIKDMGIVTSPVIEILG
ncbi:MAG: hypothetical protein LBS36_05915 [Oscillospiraceae bacterium]|nr:hypothetical protein [Oscillospiraceae bacterium]